jgi:hypothetical protein
VLAEASDEGRDSAPAREVRGGVPALVLVAAQHGQRIEARGAACRQTAGEQGDGQQQGSGSRERQHLERADFGEQARQDAGHRCGRERAQGESRHPQSHATAEHVAQDPRAACAERQAHRDLPRALSDRDGHDARDAQPGKQQAEHPESDRDHGTEPVAPQRTGVVPVDRRRAVRSQRTVNPPDGALDLQQPHQKLQPLGSGRIPPLGRIDLHRQQPRRVEAEIAMGLVRLGEARVTVPRSVELTFPAADPALVDGVRGTLARLQAARDELEGLWPDDWPSDAFVALSQTGQRIQLRPATAVKELEALKSELPGAVAGVKRLKGDETRTQKALAILGGGG